MQYASTSLVYVKFAYIENAPLWRILTRQTAQQRPPSCPQTFLTTLDEDSTQRVFWRTWCRSNVSRAWYTRVFSSNRYFWWISCTFAWYFATPSKTSFYSSSLISLSSRAFEMSLSTELGVCCRLARGCFGAMVEHLREQETPTMWNKPPAVSPSPLSVGVFSAVPASLHSIIFWTFLSWQVCTAKRLSQTL